MTHITIQKALLDATVKYAEQICVNKKPSPIIVCAGNEWIEFDFDSLLLKVDSSVTTAPTTTAPRVLKFNEETGEQINAQVDFRKQEKEVVGACKVPWREWRGGASCALMGQKQSDMASAVAVMQLVHGRIPVEDEPIDMMYREGVGPYVITNDDIEENVIKIPPCVPKQSKVLERSEHPQAVMITVAE